MNYNYSLDIEKYTWKKALLWGNFVGHCKKATKGTWGDRIVHTMIASAELMPLTSQLASVIEKLIVTNNINENIPRNKRIIKLAKSSKAIKALYKEANSTEINGIKGKWKIQFLENTHTGFEAECVFDDRRINLLSSISDENALSSYVFELTNAFYYPKHDLLVKKVYAGAMGCEEFVKESERIEYEGTKLHRLVIQEAIEEMGWSPSLDIFKGLPETFDEYWEYAKNNSHADYYREYWKKMTS